MERVAYVLCELKSRDLAPRALVAAELLRKGITVYFGQFWSLCANIESNSLGCYFFNTMNLHQMAFMEKAKARGHVVVSTDQEALPFDGKWFLCNVSTGAMAATDLFLADTVMQAAVIREHYPDTAVTVTGNPRVDLLRTAKHPRPITDRYLLFNTNFALTNSIWGEPQKALKMLLLGGGVDPNTEEGAAEIKIRFAFERATKEQLMPLIRWCASSLGLLTVVRPHPAENTEAWTSLAKEYPKLHVVTGSNPLPWIAHAEVTIHANSTTGLEAALMRKACINVSPAEFDKWCDQFVMRKVNVTVRSAQEALDAIMAFLKTGQGLEPRPSANLYPKNGAALAADAIDRRLSKATAYQRNFPHWIEPKRSDMQRKKFTVTTTEFVNVLKEVGAPRIRLIEELGDSLVILNP